MLHQKTFDTLVKRALDTRQRRTTSDYYSLISNIEHIFFHYINCNDFFIKISYKTFRYITINLIIFIIKTFLLFWYLFLFNIFLNFTKLLSRNISYTMKNKKNILNNVRSSPRLFNKNNNFNKFFRKLNNFYKKRDQLDGWKIIIF